MNSIVSSANQGQPLAPPGLKIFALALKIMGISLWVTYLVYLPLPELFQAEAALKLAGLIEPGMVFYSLATAGVLALILTWHLLGYWLWLIKEIAKANVNVARVILNPKLPISPIMVRSR